MARYIAKNIIAAGLAKRCEVQIAYAIGVAEPVSVLVNPFRTGKIPTQQFVEIVRKHFPLKPRGIIEHLDLLPPDFSGRRPPTATSAATRPTSRGSAPRKLRRSARPQAFPRPRT